MKPANAFRCAADWLRESEQILDAMVEREQAHKEATPHIGLARHRG